MDWIRDAEETRNKCMNIPDWEQKSTKYCGPNLYIAGTHGEDFDSWDEIVIYQNQISGLYFLDQTEPSFSKKELLEQLKILVKKLEREE